MISIQQLKNNTNIVHIEIPSRSFITVFSRPFFNSIGQPTLIAHTAPLKLPIDFNLYIINDIFTKIDLEANLNFQRVIWFVLPDSDSIRELNLHLHEFNYDKKTKIYELVVNGIKLKYSTLEGFSHSVAHTLSEKNVQTYFIFTGFAGWDDITLSVHKYSSIHFNRKGIAITGGNNSKRHLINHLTIRLHLFILLVTGFNEHGAVKSFAFDDENRTSQSDKSLTPRHNLVNLRSPKRLMPFTVSKPINVAEKEREYRESLLMQRQNQENPSPSPNYIHDLDKKSSPDMTSISHKLQLSSEDIDLPSNLHTHNLESHNTQKDITMDLKVPQKDESTYTSPTFPRKSIEKYTFASTKAIGDINSSFIKGKRSITTFTNLKGNIPTPMVDDKVNSLELIENNVTHPTNINSDLKNNTKLSNFLTNVSSILSEHEYDLTRAQLIIENDWLELSTNSIDLKTSFYKNNSNIMNSAFNTLKLYKENGNLKKSLRSIHNYIVDIDHVFIAFSTLLLGYNNSSLTNLYYKIGVAISKHIYIKNFKNEYNNYDEFLEKYKINSQTQIKIGVIFYELFSTQLNPIFELRGDTQQAFIKVNTQYEKQIREELTISPHSLPMVCPPKPWGVRMYGGYLLNSRDDYKKSLITGSRYHNHETRLNDNIHSAINKLNNFKFKVNTDLLNYIQSDEGSYILDHSKKENYDSYLNNIITLDIAKTYMNTPFYLNVNIDWRGRIYTQSFYLDYQGSEFSLALINLYEGKKLDENGRFFFYVYGANLFNENGTNKKRLEERFNWVITNLDKIKNMDKDFILKAESPTGFAAFCLTMRKLLQNPNSIVHNPVFLDATCSGVQHFAAMVLDLNLAKHVNLINLDDGVNDFYSALIPKINEAINNAWDDEKNEKFKDIYLTRDILKKTIMTKSYNVTSYGITEQLKNKLEKVPKIIIYKDKELKVTDYKVPTLRNEHVILNMFEVEKMANIINNNIFNQFPVLNSIYTYLTGLARIYMKLGIPLSWSTPNGLQLTQGYNSSKIEKLKINFLGKNKTVVLKKWIEKKDTVAEVQAIIPNIIHSLDGAHLTSVINTWDKYILPIHDCFGTHPNDMLHLAEIVRVTFVSLYSTGDFLKKIDNKLKDNLKDYKVNVIIKDNKEVVEIPVNSRRTTTLPLPVLPDLGELKINDVITKGKNMIT